LNFTLITQIPVIPSPKKKKMAISVLAFVNAVETGTAVAALSVPDKNISLCLMYVEKNDGM
jgi:hypothetical protein